MLNLVHINGSKAILSFLDYHTIFQMKYTCKTVAETIKRLNLYNTLDLRNTKLKNENNTIYMILSKHKFLTEIILEFKAINDTHVFKFGPELRKININYCQNLSDSSLIHIANTCINLTHLDLYVMPTLTDEGLIPIIKNCPKIIHLNLSGCKHFTNYSLSLIPEYLKELEEIDLTRCIGAKDSFLIELVTKCSKLRYLNLYALPDLNCDFLSKVIYSNLTFLDLCGNMNVNDDLFITGSKYLYNLTYLNLSWCEKITDKTILVLYDKCNNLELISMHGILGITDTSVKSLSSNGSISRKLSTIDLNSCVNVKDRSKEYLLQLFPNLKKFQHFF